MRPGDVIDGRFRLEREIARGGTSHVWRARDAHDDAVVAVKIVTCPDRDAHARFAREVGVLAQVTHPGVVRSIADGTIDAQDRYLVLSWIDGIDLAARLRRPESNTKPDAATLQLAPGEAKAIDVASTSTFTLSLAETLRLGRRIAQATGALHATGWVHRDIKPGNIVLRGGAIDDAVLVDLGTARTGIGLEDVTMGGMIVGTPAYMSPEQASASPNVGPASDVWSLGCVLYHALTGATPFEGGPLLAVLARIITEEPTPIPAFRTDVPEDVLALITRMLDKEPENRPADGNALDVELAALEERYGGRSTAVPVRRELAKRERRSRSVLVVRSDERSANLLMRIAEIARDGVDELHTLADGSVLIRVVRDATALDRARRAAHAAVALRASLPTLRMALATEQLDDTDDDDVVTRAAHLVDAAKPGTIELDPPSAELLDLHFEVAHDADRFRLTGARSVDGARTLLGRPTPWVGRRRELLQLVSLFEECVDEPIARVTLVVGEAGIGKSRLRSEVLRAMRDGDAGEGLEILFAQGDSLGAGAPFAMLASALRSACDVREGEPLGVSQEKVRARVRRVLSEEAAARVAPFIGELAGTPFPDDAHPTLGAARRDPLVMSSSTLAAWIDWLSAECARGPVALVLDDLHWGDVPTTRFVDVALSRLADRPLFVFALARPEVRSVFPSLWQQRTVQEIRLDGLSRKAATSLAREALGARADDASIDALVERAGGNVFFLEELIRSVADGGAGEHAPGTVLAVLHARLGALGDGAKRVLCAASIFGEIFTAPGARALVGDPVQAFSLDEWLEHLVEREVLTRDGESFKFRHALVRDAAYDLLTREDRTAGHLAAAGWLEQTTFAEPLALAEQFVRGGEPKRAIRWFRRAAEQALEGRDFEAALRNAERAIEAGADREQRAVLRRLQAVATYWQSRYADAARFAAEALDSSEKGTRDWFLAMSELVVSSARLADFTTVEARFAEASRAHAKAGDAAAETAQIVCLCRSTFQMIFHGRFATSDAMLERIDAIAGDASRFDPLTAAQIHHVRGVRAIHAGCVSTFLEHLERAVAAFEQGGDRNNVLLERTTVGWCWAELGDFALAEAKIRENFAACVAAGAQQAITYAKVNLGYALIHRPRALDEARRVLGEAIAECRVVGNARLEGWASAHASTAALVANEPDEALRLADEAVRLLSSAPSLLGWAEACRARALLAHGRNEEALASARRAMETLESLGGMLQGEAMPPLVLAEALRAIGAMDDARTAARDAMARLERRTAQLGRDEWKATFAALPDHVRTRAIAESL